MPRLRYLFLLLVVFIGFLGAFLSGFFLKSYFDSQIFEFPVLNQAYNILINHSFLSLPDSKALEYGMIRGLLLSSDDPYASFQEPVQHELESNDLQGSFGGVGVEIIRGIEGEILVYPIKNGPASRAGLINDDQLIQIDEMKISSEIEIDDIKAALRGPVDQSVRLIIMRKNEDDPINFIIKREEIHLPSVTYHLAPEDSSIGIINVNIIAESTSDEIKNAIDQLHKEGAGKYILDLRDNGGGLLTAGIEVTKMFLDDGIIMQQKYRGQDVETFRTSSPGIFSGLQIAILINHNTASAAEIIAGALQSHARAKLIGEPTFGKDSIQLIFDLQDGSSLHLTAAKWWIPGLDPPINIGGLQPDIVTIQDDPQIDSTLNTAIEFLKQQ
jgi:carboxyl-terminal processing protease